MIILCLLGCILLHLDLYGQKAVFEYLEKRNKDNTIQTLPDELLDLLLYPYQDSNPGISFLIQNKNEKLSRTFGLYDLQAKNKVNAFTTFRSASITKQFTAFAILTLVQDEKLSLSESLVDIFDDFPDYGKKINVHHLLIHQSGLKDYFDLISEDRNSQILDHEILEMMKNQQNTLFDPGSKFEYSNSAYAVLAMIIEKRSGKSFAAYLQQKIFDPFDMPHSFVYSDSSTLENRALGYTIAEGSIHSTDQSISSAVKGDGGIYTCPLDYSNWIAALKNRSYLSESLYETFFKPHVEINEHNAEAYAYGWRINFWDKNKVLHHSGHTKGFTNYSLYVPDKNFHFIAFSNRNNEDAIIDFGNFLSLLVLDIESPINLDALVIGAFKRYDASVFVEFYKKLMLLDHNRYKVRNSLLVFLSNEAKKLNAFQYAIELLLLDLEINNASYETHIMLSDLYLKTNDKKSADIHSEKANALRTE